MVLGWIVAVLLIVALIFLIVRFLKK